MSEVKNLVSSYNILEHLINDIAPKYFNMNELSTNRVGMFGYVNESHADLTESVLVSNMIRSRENFEATAKSRNTLLIRAAELKMIVDDATPATLPIILDIPISTILTRGNKIGDDYEFIIDRDSIVTISGYNFLFDYDIKVKAIKVIGGYNFNSLYDMSTQNNISKINNPYLLTTKMATTTGEHLFISVIVRQCEKKFITHNIIENDEISLMGLKFDYEDQLSHFNTWYKLPTDSNFSMINVQSVYSVLVSKNQYVIYDTSQSGTIKISTDENLTPPYNSELQLEIFTTKGISGNFTYISGQTKIELKTRNTSLDYTGINIGIIVNGNSTGGKDVVTMEELRSEVITQKSTLGGLSTESDLDKFFYTKDQTNNMIFVKKRSDVIDRRYTSYMIPREADLSIIPTNTLNLKIKASEFDVRLTNRNILKSSSKYSLKPGENFILNKNDTVTTAADIETAENDPTKFLFGSPYMIVANESPESVSYYLNSIDNEYIVKPDHINDITQYSFIMNKFKITRNAIAGEDFYTIETNIKLNGDDTLGIADASGAIIDNTKLKVYGAIYDGLNVAGYFPFTISNYNIVTGFYKFTATLTTDDYINIENKLRLTTGCFLPMTTTASDVLVQGIGVKMTFNIYYKETTSLTRPGVDVVIPNMSAYTLTNIYSNSDNLSEYIIDMSHLIKSQLTLTLESGVYYYNIKEVPLIRYSYLLNNVDRISDVINKTRVTLEGMAALITNNFSIDYKFYSTYGKSRYFKVGDTAELDRLNLKLAFKIRLQPTQSAAIFDEIKRHIKTYIEQLNSVSGAVKSVYISNIITSVENTFKIKNMELIKINDYTVLYQSVDNKTPDMKNMTSSEIREYVPEFVNISINDISIIPA
jgi:hypothetical protein